MFSIPRTHQPELRFYSIMANILDQYEEASQVYNVSSSISKSGFGEMRLEDETPMFSKKRVNFAPSDKITHLSVSVDTIIIAMANNILLRINLRQPDHPEEIELRKYTSNLQLSGLYLDPTGHHTLLSLTPKNSEIQPELLYLSRTSVKPKQLNKIRSHEITSVAWNYSNQSRASTGPILLGTSKGLIFETEIAAEGDSLFQSGLEEYWKQVFDVGKGTNTPITGMHMYRVANSDKYFIMVTTINRMYQFKGYATDDKPVLQQIFKTYLNIPEKCESIQSFLPYSKLEIYYSNIKDTPKRFGWLTGNGIYYGQIDVAGEEEIQLDNCELLKFPDNSGPAPLAFVLTEFHVLLLYSDHVKGVSLLDQQLVFEDFYIETYGKLGSIVREPCRGAIWAFTERNVFTYKVIQEDRNVWQIYVERGEFDLARNYCKDNPIYVDQVTLKQAEKLFQDGDYDSSAFYYSQTMSISFEEIALKFLQISEINSLKTYLNLKLKNMKKEDKTQTTMVVIWLIELYLGQLGTLRDQNGANTEEYETIDKELDEFMSKPAVAECIKNNKGTVYDLMYTHGDTRNLIRLAIANRDYERVIRHHIYKGDYLQALEVLKKTNLSRKDLYYHFAPTLMQYVPRELVETLKGIGKHLDPTKLLPALLMCNDKQKASLEAIKYLENGIHVHSWPDQALHNYLLALYAKYQPKKLKDYLALQGQDASSVYYDIHYALRLCQENSLTEACVQLYALLGLWESAVKLALTVNVDVAIKTANMQQENLELTKKLWLIIAKHVVEGKDDVKSAMEFLKRSELLKIEDILPYFSDFVTIDDFKEAICTSLEEYNQHINDLKYDMEEATKSAKIIAQEVSAFKNRYSVIKPSDICSLCELQLLLRPFYIFPCGHYFHSDCLTSELLPLLPVELKYKLMDLQMQLNQLTSTQQVDNVSTTSTSLSAKDLVKCEIDNIVAADCYFCGDYMVDSIDKPFVLESEYSRVMKEWE